MCEVLKQESCFRDNDRFKEILFFFLCRFAGEWILIVVHLFKQIQYNKQTEGAENASIIEQWKSIGDENGSLLFYISASAIGSYAIYFGIGGFLHVI